MPRAPLYQVQSLPKAATNGPSCVASSSERSPEMWAAPAQSDHDDCVSVQRYINAFLQHESSHTLDDDIVIQKHKAAMEVREKLWNKISRVVEL